MKIAISSTGPGLDAPVDPRFGRCQYFLVIETETQEFDLVRNDAAGLSGGAGIQAAQLVANSGAQAVITGNLGPNAADALAAGGLKVYLGAAGTVQEALQQWQEGQLRESTDPSVDAHFGGAAPRGMGRGRGMGMGRGMGRGLGRGMGQRRGAWLQQALPAQEPEGQELEELKRAKDRLLEQMSRLEERIRKLEKSRE